MKKHFRKILAGFLAGGLFTISAGKEIKVGVVLSQGGLGDKSFNDSAYAGLKRAEKELGVKTKYVEPHSWSEDSTFINEFVENRYDLIIAASYTAQDAMEKIAKENPDTKFAIVDTEATGENIASLIFKDDEGSFMVGALAGMMSNTQKIGFIGALDIPLINNFRKGFEEGAKYINPNIEIVSTYIGGDAPFSDPVKGKEQAIAMLNQKVDIIYHATGNSGNGIMEAVKTAKRDGVYVIGVDSDQDYIVPGKVLTSMVKNVDNAVFDIIKETKEGRFRGGVHLYGLKENGVGTSEFKFTKEKIGLEKLNKLKKIRDGIISEDVKIKK